MTVANSIRAIGLKHSLTVELQNNLVNLNLRIENAAICTLRFGALSLSEVPPRIHDQLWLFYGGGRSKKGNGTNRTAGSKVLKLFWGGNMLHFPGHGNLNGTKPGNSSFALRAFPGVFLG